MQNMTPWLRSQPEDSANQSTLGEEDPGAAVDAMPWSRDHASTSTGTSQAQGASFGGQGGDLSDRATLLRRALSRWENEGGADGDQPPVRSESGEGKTEVDLTNAELVQLQIRVIALENLVTALLASATEQTPDLARAIAANITPRPGCTPHHLTIHAAAQMVHLVERSGLFRKKPGL